MKKLMFFVVLISAIGLCDAQSSPTDYPTVVPPPPTVASLMRFEEVPVDYYTGQPNITIPLGNIPINKDLSYPIALQYNTQALRVEERSGWTGTGFSMATGGVITRTIQGVPDEMNTQYGGIGIFHLTEMMDYNSLSLNDKIKFMWETDNGETKKDALYDLFQYSFFGKSGRFIIEKTGSSLKAVIIGSETNDKIALSHDSNFNLTEFRITDTKGYVYTFNETNDNRISTFTSTTSQYGGQSNVTTDTSGGQDVPNTWYLKTVKTPNGITLCTFNYNTVGERYSAPMTVSYNFINGQPVYGSDQTAKDVNQAMTLPKIVVNTQDIDSKQKYVSEAILHNGVKIEYIISDDHPEYDPSSWYQYSVTYNGGAKLNSIRVRNADGSLNKEIDLIYQTNTYGRLFMTQVREQYGNENLTYSLSYNNMNDLPAFDDQKQDSWGYYKDNVDSFLADPEKATTGVLTSITYPTGGKKEFVFESNSYSFIGDQPIDPTTILANYTTQSYGDQLSYSSTEQHSINPVSNDKYVVYLDSQFSMDLITTLNSVSGQNVPGFSYGKHKIRFVSVSPNSGSGISTPPLGGNGGYNPNNFYNDSGTDYEFEIIFGQQNIGVSTGWYMVEIYTPQPELYQNQWNFTLDIAIKVREYNLVTKVQKGGGIRIKEILFKDGGVQQKKIEYGYNENHYNSIIGSVDSLRSSGSYEHNPSHRSYNRTITHPFVSNSCGSGFLSIIPASINYKMTIDVNRTYTPTTKGNYVGYKHIVVKESGNGRQNFTYISPRDVQILTAANTTFPFKPIENLDYKRGSLEKKEILDEDDKVLIEETYEYQDVSRIAKSSIFPYEAGVGGGGTCEWDQFYNNYTNYLNNWPDNPITSCGASGANTYSNCVGNPDMSALSYNHIIGVLLPNKVITKEFFYNGSTLTNTITSTQRMDYNVKNVLKEQITEIDKGGVIEELTEKIFYVYHYPTTEFTSTQRNAYTQMNALNMIAEPIYIETHRGSSLLTKTKTIYKDFSTNNYRPSEVVIHKANESEKVQIGFYKYDTYGNLMEVAKEDGTRVVYIWGYDHSLPVAKIENATFTDIPTTLYNQIVANSNSDLNSGTLSTEAALKASLESLRNHSSMSDSMVTSFTYDPLTGITSMTDPRGQTIYYEYDEHHRLKFVKDAYGKIVSANQYNYKY